MAHQKLQFTFGDYSAIHEDPLNWTVYLAGTRKSKETGAEYVWLNKLAYTPSLVAALKYIAVHAGDSAMVTDLEGYIVELNAIVDRLAAEVIASGVIPIDTPKRSSSKGKRAAGASLLEEE